MRPLWHVGGCRPGRGGLGVVTVALLAAGTACADGTADPAATSRDYETDLARACTTAQDALDALPTPPEQISRRDFATEVARVLSAEVEAVRRLRPPTELDDDHRAFVRNTDDQVGAWRRLAESVDGDPGSVSEISTELLELSLGRDDLATEMGVDACRRQD